VNYQTPSRNDVEGHRRGTTFLLDAFPRRLFLTPLLLALGCSHRPPPDFAPDPGLVARITQIRMDAPSVACPGQSFPVSYTAVLNDGALVPFENRYDKKHPPRLHVMFLERTSATATPLENGAWTAERDPLATVTTGFRLSVVLRQKSSLQATTTIEPEYSCLPHAFGFQGAPGERSSTGGDGPDVTVRLAIVRSPYVERLLVAGIEIGNALPFYTVADANVVPPRDWLIIESRGGRGGRGAPGARGTKGADGQPGCPSADGGPGAPGGRGGSGGQGGRGGRITIIVPTEVPFLAGLVDARTPGGPGGDAGAGGDGGSGGAAGQAPRDGTCPAGKAGPAGAKGASGDPGQPGSDGWRPQVITVSARDVFGTRVPPGLADLLGGSGPGRRP